MEILNYQFTEKGFNSEVYAFCFEDQNKNEYFVSGQKDKNGRLTDKKPTKKTIQLELLSKIIKREKEIAVSEKTENNYLLKLCIYNSISEECECEELGEVSIENLSDSGWKHNTLQPSLFDTQLEGGESFFEIYKNGKYIACKSI